MRIFYTLLLIFSILSTGALPISARSMNSNMDKSSEKTVLAAARAYTDGSGIWLNWQMASEFENLGFNIFRETNGKSIQINDSLIAGGFLRFNSDSYLGGSYTYFDPRGDIDSRYRIETVPVSKQRGNSFYVPVEKVKDLKDFTGISSTEMRSISKKSGSLENLAPSVPKSLIGEIDRSYLPPDIEQQRIIAGQPGVKIGTSREGIYRVTRGELEDAGFNVNLPHSNWQLYLNGNQQSIVVSPGGEFIEFYGQGMDTIDSGVQVYFLINGTEAGERIQNTTLRRLGGNVLSRNYQSRYSFAARNTYFPAIRNGSANNFFGFLISSSGAAIPLSVSGIDFTAPSVRMNIKIQGLTFTPHTIDVKINGNVLTPISGNNHDYMTREFIIPTNMLFEGENSVELKVPVATNDYSALDSITIDYSRKHQAINDTVSFYTDNYKQTELIGFNSREIRVLDVSESDSPKLITNVNNISSGSSFGVSIPANRGRLFFAASDQAVRQADFIKRNAPSSLSTSTHNSRYLIITHNNWKKEAFQWADYRTSDGFTSEVVVIDDIFDEFSYGVTSSLAIRSFLQYAKNNWTGPPEYVLILGDASYDPRRYRPFPDTNFVPTLMFDTAYEETGSDDGLADFDADGLAEIAVGRITAKTSEEVSDALQRTIAFEQSSQQGFSRGALFASDLSIGYDFAGMSQRLANELPSGSTSVMVNRGDPNSHTTLLSQLDTGKFLVNYSGHGAPSLWAASSFYHYTDVPNIANGENYSVFTMLTCLNGYFLETNFDSLAELLIKAPNGGAVAAWASSGKTTPDVQEVLATRFYRKISEGNIARMGDLIRDAKQNLLGGRDVRLTWTLMGDPALKVR